METEKFFDFLSSTIKCLTLAIGNLSRVQRIDLTDIELSVDDDLEQVKDQYLKAVGAKSAIQYAYRALFTSFNSWQNTSVEFLEQRASELGKKVYDYVLKQEYLVVYRIFYKANYSEVYWSDRVNKDQEPGMLKKVVFSSKIRYLEAADLFTAMVKEHPELKREFVLQFFEFDDSTIAIYQWDENKYVLMLQEKIDKSS